MFESIMKFFNKLKKKEEKTAPNSKEAAKERLHLVLMQDRANVSADFLELMKQEIIEVIKKYIDIDEGAIDVRLTNKENEDGTNGAPALYANIPILNIKNEARKMEKKKEEEKDSKQEEIKDKKEDNQKEDKKQNKENQQEKIDNKQNEQKETENKEQENKTGEDNTSKEDKMEEKDNQEMSDKEENIDSENKEDIAEEKETKEELNQNKKN